MILLAPAKINLRLEVEGKREDGYHLLRMINARVNLYDEIEINESSSNQIAFSIPEYNSMENNICLKIVNEMCERYNIKKRWNIYITKNIPSGAGLGGGSSDAAELIHYINQQENLNLSMKEMIDIGVKYGADIPYCLFKSPAYVSGIGEKIELLNQNIDYDVILVNPNIHCSTKEVFKQVEKYTTPTDVEILKDYIKSGDITSLLYNDLEEASFKVDNRLAQIKKDLSKYGDVCMSGSGSTMLLFPNKQFCWHDFKKENNTYLLFKCHII